MTRWLITLSIMTTVTGYTQVSQPQRYEVEHKNSNENFKLVSLHQEGLALFRETNKYEGPDMVWELIILDTALQERSSQKIKINARNNLIGYDHVRHSLSYLFRRDSYEKGDIMLVTCNTNTFEVKQHTFKPEIALRLTHFSQVGSNFVLGGYLGTEPGLLLFDPTTENLQIIPGFFQKEVELVDVRANINETFNVVLMDRSNREERKLFFRTYDQKGNLLIEDAITTHEDRVLQTGMMSTLQREDLVMLGTWGTRNSKQSNGFYAVSFDPFQDQQIQYYTLGDFQHYFDYLKPKRAKKLTERIKQDSEGGRIPNYANYILPYRIIEHEHGYILLADVYNPSGGFQNNYYNPYNNNPYYYDPYWGMGYYTPRRVYNPAFNPYGNNVNSNEESIRVYETTVIAFDEKGGLKWDQSMKLDEIKISSPEQVTDCFIWNNQLYFLYKKESELKIKIISLDNGETTTLTEKVKQKKEGDEVRSEDEQDGAVRHWYDNTFYVWGYQSIKNKANREDTNRSVFYVNKVQVR